MEQITATVTFGKTEVAQHWEFLDGNPHPHLVLLRAEHNGQSGVPLVLELKEKCTSTTHRSGHRIYERNYKGPLDAADAFFLKG